MNFRGWNNIYHNITQFYSAIVCILLLYKNWLMLLIKEEVWEIDKKKTLDYFQLQKLNLGKSVTIWRSFQTKQDLPENSLLQFSPLFNKEKKILFLFRGELQLWASKWKNIPENSIDLVNNCDKELYPIIKAL